MGSDPCPPHTVTFCLAPSILTLHVGFPVSSETGVRVPEGLGAIDSSPDSPFPFAYEENDRVLTVMISSGVLSSAGTASSLFRQRRSSFGKGVSISNDTGIFLLVLIRTRRANSYSVRAPVYGSDGVHRNRRLRGLASFPKTQNWLFHR